MRRLLAGAMAIAVLAACSVFMGLPTPTCDPIEFDPPPTLTCDVAVKAAVDSLPAHGAISALEFVYGSICPPNARCLFRTGDAGTVIVTFSDRTQQSIYVTLAAGRLAVEPPVPYSPPS